MMYHEIQSERLSLRPVGVDDVKSLHALWSAEPVRRFLWDGEVIPLEQTREIVEKNRALFEEFGFGIWGVHERGSDDLVGFAGYWHFRTPPSLELFFGVTPGHWNRGIATEASRLLIRYGFEELGFEKIDASTDFANTASIRVLEGLDMSFHRREVVDGLDTLFYRLTRADWQAALTSRSRA